MYKKFKHAFQKICTFCTRKTNRVVCSCILLAAGIFFIILLLHPVIHHFEERYLDHVAGTVYGEIHKQYASLEQGLQELAMSQQLQTMIRAKDIAGLRTFTQEERTKRNLSLFMITDEEGVMLSQENLTSNKGGYIFNTTAWGNAVAQNGQVSTIEKGVSSPLIMISGQKITASDGTVLGAIFIGYPIDDTYLRMFKNEHMPSFLDIAAYTKQKGVIASSFVNPDAQRLVSYYFTPASPWVQQTEGIAHPKFMALDGKYFFARNIIMPGLESSPGGFILFYPYSAYTDIVTFLVVALIGLFILLSVFFIQKKRALSQQEVHLYIRKNIGYIFAFFLFSACIIFFGADSSAEKNTVSSSFNIPPFYNATLSLEPETGIFTNTSSPVVTVMLSSGKEPVKTVKAFLTFNPEKVSIERIDTSKSLCDATLFTNTSIDNTAGRISLVCTASPNGFQAENDVLAQIMVQQKQLGQYTMNFDMSGTHVFANDGYATDVLRTATGGSYQVKQSSDSAAMPLLPLFSFSHPNSAQWYTRRHISLSWDPTHAYTSYVYAFDENATTTPRTDALTDKTGMSVIAMTDGIYYFHLAGIRGNLMGPVSHFKIMIDTTPPDVPKFQLNSDSIQEGETVRALVSSADAMSGLQRFLYGRIDSAPFLPFTSPALFTFSKPGSYTLAVRAFDRAGNYSEASKKITVTKKPWSYFLSRFLPAVITGMNRYFDR